MILYFDTETSGIRPGQICQLSYILQEGVCVRAKNFFFTVDHVDYSAYMVHGFSVEKLKVLSSGNRFCDHVAEIKADFESADVIIGHNVSFDVMFMRAEFERLYEIFYIKNAFCSMKSMTSVCKLPGKRCGYKYPKLSELCTYFNIEDKEISKKTNELFGCSNSFHDARFDTVAVYLAINKGLEKEEVLQSLKEYL